MGWSDHGRQDKPQGCHDEEEARARNGCSPLSVLLTVSVTKPSKPSSLFRSVTIACYELLVIAAYVVACEALLHVSVGSACVCEG
eukprot:m.17620 g.17620  ORF g.17620 m.17620 type:complete len:85 (-) comp7515_c0_seq1:1056-1310(-)